MSDDLKAEPETPADGDKPDDARFINIAWNKTTDQFACESNVIGRIDVIGMLGYAQRHLLAALDMKQAQKKAQDQRIADAMRQPLRAKGS